MCIDVPFGTGAPMCLKRVHRCSVRHRGPDVPTVAIVEMDGFDTRQAVVVVAATNRPDNLDQALRRARAASTAA